MHERGWKTFIIRWAAVKQWGKLRDVGQQALNVVNNVGLPPTEMEVARRIASFGDECDAYNQPFSARDAVAQAAAENPPCQRYAKSIATWARDYGGGTGAPLVGFVDSVASFSGENVIIGSQVFANVVNLRWPVPHETLSYLRASLLMLALTPPEGAVSEGISQVLKDHYFRNLTKKTAESEVLECNKGLSEGYALGVNLEEHDGLVE